jgi:hypothetical protein
MSVQKTKRQRIVDAVVARMKTILVANSYQTDAGQLVVPYAVRFDESELAAASAKCALGVFDLIDEVSKASMDSKGATHRMRVQVRVFKSGAMTLEGLRTVIGDVVDAVGKDILWTEQATGKTLAMDTEPAQEGFIVPTEAMEVAAAAVEFIIVFATAVFDPYQ